MNEKKDASPSIKIKTFHHSEETPSSNEESDNEDLKAGAIYALPNETPVPRVNIDRSSDVHVGPRSHYSGPVIIHQYLNKSEPTNNNDTFIKTNSFVEGVQVNGSLFPSNGTITNIPGSQLTNPRNNHTEGNSPSVDNRLLSFIFLKKDRRLHIAIFICLLILLVASVSFGIAISLPIKGLVTPTPIPSSPSLPTLPNQLHIYSKADWRGLDSRQVKYMLKPALFVVISHTVTSQCYNFSMCAEKIQSIQNFHFSKSFDDIGHNFIISLQGDIYEGRGWNVESYHEGVVKGCNIAIGLIGNFLKDYPSKQMLQAIQDLIELGISKNAILSNYILIGHKQISLTESPGTNVINEIKKWPHYVSDLTSLRIENCHLMNTSTKTLPSEEKTTRETNLPSME